MKINLRAMMLASGLMISMIPFMPGEASAEEVSVPDSRTLSNITYMQDMSGQICENTSENTTKQLIDSRDGKSYWVTKLKDGNCWMTQNLDLDIPADGLSAKDTDIPVDWNSSSTYKPEATQITTNPDFGTTNNNIKSWDPAQGGAEKYCNASGCRLIASANDGHDAQGNYYSWGAATAGQAATFGTDDSTTYPANATQSICPKGWTLPTSSENSGQYYTLLDGLGAAQITTSPYYFVYGGYVLSSTLNYAGREGNYWPSTTGGASHAYFLYFATSVIPSNGNYRYLGYSVRCVARPKESKKTLSDLTYMQEMTTGVCEKSAENETKQLIDQRDGKTYWVAKLKDGNCWMTQNLDLDIPDEGLSAKDTDIPLDWNSSSTYKPEATQTTANPNFGTTNNNIKSWNPGANGGEKYCNASGCNLTTSTNSGHDAQGNYYSWGAATAGQAASLTSSTSYEQATQSICPKGWQLPENQASTAGTTIVKSYRNLLDNYGWSWNQGSDPTKYSDSLTGTKDGNTYDIRSNPLYFVYGGRVNRGSLEGAGSSGYYWSSTANNNSDAYILNFWTSVVPSNGTGRYLGFPVRCVSRADVPDNNDNVTITITPTLSLDVAATTEIPYTAGGVSTGNLSATVKSNQQHTLQLSAAQPNLVNEADNSKIIPADAGVSAGTSAWGIKKKESAAGTSLGSITDVSAYTALTSTPDIFYRSAAGSDGTASVNFTVGISTDSSVASGTYSTNVTVTATTI